MTLKILFIYSLILFALPNVSFANSEQLELAKALVRQRDYVAAVKLYRALAIKGDAEAQYLYSSMLRSGRGIKKNDKNSFEWARKAAIQNNVKAQYTFGNMLQTGFTTEIDEASAKFWYEKAAKQGHQRAKKKLKSLTSVSSSLESINTKDRELLFRHAAQKGDLAQVKKLLEFNTDINARDESARTALMDAVLNNQKYIVIYLISKNANPNLTDRFGDAAIHLAAKNGFLSIVKILKKSEADFDLTDKNGNTPLMLSIIGEHKKTAQWFINNKSHLHVKNNKQQNAITLANIRKNKPIVLLLKKRGAKLTVKSKNKSIVNLKFSDKTNSQYKGWSAMTRAAWKGQTKLIKALIKKGHKIDSKDSLGFTGLMRAAMKGKKKTVAEFLKQKAKINLLNNDSKTAISLAIENNHPQTALIFMNKPFNANQQDINGNTLLHIAVKANEPSIIKILLKKGADPKLLNNDKVSPISLALNYANNKIVVIFLGHSENALVTKTKEGDSLLYYAVSNNSLKLIKVLKSKGVHLKETLNNGNNILMIAAGKGYEEITHYLLQQGFDLDKRNDQGNTALLMAAISNQTKIVKAIIKAGANPDLRNNQREQAITYAKKHKNAFLIKLLEKASVEQGGIIRFFN